MKIKTKLYASTIISIVLLSIFAISLFIFSLKVNTEQRKMHLTDIFAKAISSVIIRSQEYTTIQSERTERQLDKKIKSLGIIIKESESQIPLEIIHNSFKSLNNSYTHLKSVYKERKELIKKNENPAEIERTIYLEEALTTLLFAESRKIRATASQIYSEAHEKTSDLQRIGNWVITLFSFLLVVIIGITTLRIAKLITTQLTVLRKSADNIGTGDLDSVVPDLGSDEFGDLSHAFESMRRSRKQAEEALRNSEVKYRTIFENIQDVYYETSMDGTILEVSPSIENAYQYSRNELLGKSLYDICANSEERGEILKLILDKGKVNDFEITLTDKDGIQHPCSISTLLIRDEQSNPIKLVGTMRDISERKRAESERRRLEAQLIQSQKMESIGNLAGGIAHDFNNILTSVIGYTELLLDKFEKGTQIENNLQEVYTAGKRARDLVRQILAFARQSDDKLKPIQVDIIAAEVLKFIRSSIPTTIEIRQNIESDSLIMGNGTQVHQILMNLFTNAAYAMEDKGGILEFSLKDVVMDSGVIRENLDLKPGNYIEIKVSDTGAGIAPEIIDAIFDPYFTTKGPGEGTGMGLAVAHGIIESYGGKISVDSKPGQGTVFTIYLSITGKHQEHRPYQPEEIPAGTERILFVDDEVPIAKMEGQLLESLGYTTSIRTSSIEALELFRTKPNDFDLVVTDMTMPNMTGDRLAIELMKIRPDIPVILCTGYSKKISDESASEMGIKAFVYKPIVKADLAKTVRKVLDEAMGSAQV